MKPDIIKKDSVASQRWDKEYRGGRYHDEPPIEFVSRIKEILEKNPDVSKGRGLYIGCGNGRNYIPLADSGLDVFGIDVSQVAVRQLSEKRPDFADRLLCVDFTDFDSCKLFDYIISIQVFQHGTEERTKKYFEKVLEMLKPGGLLFLRVNSASTEIYFEHTVHQGNSTGGGGGGGLTIQYGAGSKKDLYIHFYSRQEIDKICEDFDLVVPLYESTTKRIPPETGSWSQWELALRRK